jgi:hypothetical protein
MAKAILTFSILVDADEINGRTRDVRAKINLYREDGALVWRMGGELGDEVEALPRPGNVHQAKIDAREVYPSNSAWKSQSSWM